MQKIVEGAPRKNEVTLSLLGHASLKGTRARERRLAKLIAIGCKNEVLLGRLRQRIANYYLRIRKKRQTEVGRPDGTAAEGRGAPRPNV